MYKCSLFVGCCVHVSSTGETVRSEGYWNASRGKLMEGEREREREGGREWWSLENCETEEVVHVHVFIEYVSFILRSLRLFLVRREGSQELKVMLGDEPKWRVIQSHTNTCT